jgi:hypothetical protein
MIMQRTWVQTIFQPLVVATMMACLAISVVQLLQLVVPTWSGVYLTLIVFVAALEAMAARRLVRRYRLGGGDLLRFRAGEWALILIALKLGSYTNRGIDALLADIALWREDITYVFTPEYVIAIILTLITWAMAGDIENDLTELATPDAGVPINRAAIQSGLIARFFWGGFILLVVAGITRIGVMALLKMTHPPVPGIIVNALLYFLLGLVLLSQARLTALQTRWQAQDIPTPADIGSRWSRASLGFILMVAAIALLLPTSYSYGLLESLGLFLGFILQFIQSVVGLILFLLSLPFLLLLSLLGVEAVPMPAAAPALPPPGVTQPGAGGPSLWDLLRSLIFWGLIIGIVIYVLRSYFGYREDLLQGLRMVPWLGRLWAFLLDLWRQLRGAAAEAIEPLRRRLADTFAARTGAGADRLLRWRRLSSMSPRERVQYYYLSIVHRGEQAGHARRPSQTPREYSASLRQHRPDTEPDLTELTDAFVEARYSRQETTETTAERVRRYWLRIKQTLKRKPAE